MVALWQHFFLVSGGIYLGYLYTDEIDKINIDNLNPSTYSKLLYNKHFWKQFNGEKLLIYQEDSYLFHNRILII